MVDCGLVGEMKLETKTLRRIDAVLRIGQASQVDIARQYGMTSVALACQLSRARKRKLLPPTVMGRRKSLQAYCADVDI